MRFVLVSFIIICLVSAPIDVFGKATQLHFADSWINPSLYVLHRGLLSPFPAQRSIEYFSRYNPYGKWNSTSPLGESLFALLLEIGSPLRRNLMIFPVDSAGEDSALADLNMDGYAEIVRSIYRNRRLKMYWNSPTGLANFTLEPCACPVINWVSFTEETLRDTFNLIRLCFDALDPDGDPFTVQYRMLYGDSAVPMLTIYDTVSSPPGPHMELVNNGEHCIVWDMRQDFWGYEACNFNFEVIIGNQAGDTLLVTDSIPIMDAEGVAWDGVHLWVSRSSQVTGVDTQCIYKIDPATHEILDSCCWYGWEGFMADMVWHDGYLWWMGGGLSWVRARIFQINPDDCSVIDTSQALWGGTRWGQGIYYHNGYFWVNDARGYIRRVSMPPAYDTTLWLSLNDTSLAYGGDSVFYGTVTADGMCFAMDHIWIIRNSEAPFSYILWKFDTTGSVVDTFILPSDPGGGPEGLTFDGSCFWYANHDRNMVYRLCFWTCSDTLRYTGCLDSAPPRVLINYCGDTLRPCGLNSIWVSYWDLNGSGGDQCSVMVDGHFADTIAGVDLLTFPDTFSFHFYLDNRHADTTFLFYVWALYDSFGNEGGDSCEFYVLPCREVEASVLCPLPCYEFSSCGAGQTVTFLVADTTGCYIDRDRIFFQRVVSHNSGTADTVLFQTPSHWVTIGGETSVCTLRVSFPDVVDGDSVVITLDSLFNKAGCKTIP